MKPLCVIPARRGSKRLALKNIRQLAGKPMLAYSIEAARASGLFDQVFVSTEDAEIGRIAEDYGAVYHQRPAELAGDLVSATDVCLEVYEVYNAHCTAPNDTASVEPYDSIMCLQPSSPLRTAEDICGAWEAYCKANADYLVSVTFIDPHYFHWAVQQQDDGWAMFFGDKYMIERPLLPPVYRPNGSIKIGRAEPLLAHRNFFGPRLTVYPTPEERSVHVAEQFDFDLAEFLLSRRVSQPAI